MRSMRLYSRKRPHTKTKFAAKVKVAFSNARQENVMSVAVDIEDETVVISSEKWRKEQIETKIKTGIPLYLKG